MHLQEVSGDTEGGNDNRAQGVQSRVTLGKLVHLGSGLLDMRSARNVVRVNLFISSILATLGHSQFSITQADSIDTPTHTTTYHLLLPVPAGGKVDDERTDWPSRGGTDDVCPLSGTLGLRASVAYVRADRATRAVRAVDANVRAVRFYRH